jgi:hypothetical protein
MAKTITEKILVDGVLRTMSKEEHDNYSSLIQAMQMSMDSKIEAEQIREIAIAKLVALGLTEQDLRAIGI